MFPTVLHRHVLFIYMLYMQQKLIWLLLVLTPFCLYSLLLFWLFFLLFSMNFKFNAGLNFNNISLFHLIAKFYLVSFLSMKKAFYNWPLKCKKDGRVLNRAWFDTPRCLTGFFQTEKLTHLQYFCFKVRNTCLLSLNINLYFFLCTSIDSVNKKLVFKRDKLVLSWKIKTMQLSARVNVLKDCIMT